MHNNIIHIVSPCVGQIKDATHTLRKQDPTLSDSGALKGVKNAKSNTSLMFHINSFYIPIFWRIKFCGNRFCRLRIPISRVHFWQPHAQFLFIVATMPCLAAHFQIQAFCSGVNFIQKKYTHHKRLAAVQTQMTSEKNLWHRSAHHWRTSLPDAPSRRHDSKP